MKKKLAEQEVALRVDHHTKTMCTVNETGLQLCVRGKLRRLRRTFAAPSRDVSGRWGAIIPIRSRLVSNLGSLLYSQGKLTESDPFLRRAIEEF